MKQSGGLDTEGQFAGYNNGTRLRRLAFNNYGFYFKTVLGLYLCICGSNAEGTLKAGYFTWAVDPVVYGWKPTIGAC